jgi:thiol-disulfide isomerase/thioredoxin
MTTRPILEKLAQEYMDDVELLLVNADDSREILERFHIFGIPTVIALRNGREMGRVTGAQNEGIYRTVFKSLSEGIEIKASLSQFDRMLRLGAGALFIMTGIYNHNWMVSGIGGVIAFTGIHDRCPIWQAAAAYFKKTLALGRRK